MAQSRGYSVTVGPQGRLVIPAGIRRRLGLKSGDKLLVRIQGQSIVLEERETVLARVKGCFDAVPRDVSLVDELIAERRAAAEREEDE
ncbi:MAG: AbrB/MazE/SpoVT family DNA-binding domain-containing protein [Chloroflexota bacterium]|nr:MAG: AbrB/MazE/SpoVT family DNA-binding domain-containing protein [Chloroflexota bacterium]